MSLSLADHFQVPQTLFAASGALDPILDVDTRLFIDPALLRITEVEELRGSYAQVVEHFNTVLRVVRAIQSPDPSDRMWREADRLLTFPEMAGLSIGYASSGTNGSGMGKGIRERLLRSVWEIVRAGTEDATIFELVGIFEEQVGPDRISDMIAKIISSDLIRFTQRVCSDCGIPMQAHRVPYLRREEDLPTHPLKKSPMILVPQDVLRDLPVALTFGDISWVAEHNEGLRDELNRLIGFAWGELTAAEKKERRRDIFKRRPDILIEVINAYRAQEAQRYDFDADPAGQVIWYRVAKDVAQTSPLALALSANPTLEEVEGVVLRICEHFKVLIEDNQLARLLYNTDKSPKHEEAAQLLFFGIADAYCTANNLDLAPESDAGRGPVDFKVSRGADAKVVVELKLTSNKHLQRGFESQLPIYQAAERAQRGIYLVVNNGGITDNRLTTFRASVQAAGPAAPTVLWVDGSIRPSASKEQPPPPNPSGA